MPKRARWKRDAISATFPRRRRRGGRSFFPFPDDSSARLSSCPEQEWDGEMFPQAEGRGNASRAPKFRSEDGSGSRGSDADSAIDEKNKHLFFDEAVIFVAGGAGGDGEAWTTTAKSKTVKNFKYHPGGQQRKFIDLPSAEPADGGAGGDVYVRVNRACDSLLPFHEKKVYRAKKGYHGSAATGAGAGRADRSRVAPEQEDLYIDVPPGTVVRRKRSGAVLGDLTEHGQTLLLAAGGAGGVAARRARLARMRGGRSPDARLSEDVEVSDIEVDEVFSYATNGDAGQELSVELLMRVVADVGLVGLPNAGKSSVLRAVTRASPEVAAYPFTTLMPNLGVVQPADERQARGDDRMDFARRDADEKPAGPTLADLPGLIRGAHKGRGLGRAFLRHLRRTRAMLVVVDASGQNPVEDYKTVREELRLYNPEYVQRPHVLALNKMDLEWAALRTEELTSAIKNLKAEDIGEPPVAVLPVSAAEGIGMDALLVELGKLMEEQDDARVEKIRRGIPLGHNDRETTGEGTTMKIRF
jgi:GTPase involved in cell partitioning and DNA repair